MAFEDVYADVSSTSYVAGYYDEVNDEYADVLHDLLPTGQAWNYADGSEEHSLLRALGYPLKRVVLRGLDLLREFHPDTMFELLSDWERVLGLPGDNPSPPSTVASRRLAVHARLLGYGDPNIEFFETMASELGYTDAYVNQHFLSSFVPGSVAGDPCASKWQYVWEMVTPRGDDDILLQWSLENVAPEHAKLVMFWLLNPEQQAFDSPGAYDFRDVVYNGSDLWCAVGNNGSIQTSPDGETWTKQTAAGGYIGDFYAVAYDTANSLWCIVGETGEIQTSPDGSTWTHRAAGGAYVSTFRSVAHDQSGLWVAVGDNCMAQTSPDGITWTVHYPVCGGMPINWHGVAYGLGKWVICGYYTGGANDGRIQTSSDGITWTIESPVGTPDKFYDIKFNGNNQFIVVGANSQLQTSPDGSKWRRRESPSAASLDFLKTDYAGDRWIVVGESGELIESWYGEDWKRQVLTKTDFYGIGYGDGICCLVGGTADDQVYTAEV